MRWHHYYNPNFEEEKCCANCIHFYDESGISACIVNEYMRVFFDDGKDCEKFKGESECS